MIVLQERDGERKLAHNRRSHSKSGLLDGAGLTRAVSSGSAKYRKDKGIIISLVPQSINLTEKSEVQTQYNPPSNPHTLVRRAAMHAWNSCFDGLSCWFPPMPMPMVMPMQAVGSFEIEEAVEMLHSELIASRFKSLPSGVYRPAHTLADTR